MKVTTFFKILLVKIMLCGKLHYQNVLDGQSVHTRSDHVLQALNQLDVFFRVVGALLDKSGKVSPK